MITLVYLYVFTTPLAPIYVKLKVLAGCRGLQQRGGTCIHTQTSREKPGSHSPAHKRFHNVKPSLILSTPCSFQTEDISAVTTQRKTGSDLLRSEKTLGSAILVVFPFRCNFSDLWLPCCTRLVSRGPFKTLSKSGFAAPKHFSTTFSEQPRSGRWKDSVLLMLVEILQRWRVGSQDRFIKISHTVSEGGRDSQKTGSLKSKNVSFFYVGRTFLQEKEKLSRTNLSRHPHKIPPNHKE